MHLGVQLLLMGLFKKLAIGDRMACMADPVFANPDLYPAPNLWLAVIAYALQIYERYGCWLSALTGLSAGQELQHALLGGQHGGLLAALAHFFIKSPSRIRTGEEQ